jgi:hypothetical protein
MQRKCFMYMHMITMNQRNEQWLNAQFAEKTSRQQRKLGRWLENQTKKVNAHNSPSACTNAAIKLSGKF